MLHRLVRGFVRHRLTWLFTALVLTLGVDPVLDAAGMRFHTSEWLLAASLVTAVLGAWRHRASRVATLGLALALGTWAVLHALQLGGIATMTAPALAVGALCAAGAIVPTIFAAGPVDTERIAGALGAYLLVGFGFGGLFLSLEAVHPGSFTGQFSTGPLTVDDTVYFSFVTLATLGYGDIVPFSRPARALATTEAIFGQLYLAVLVARLVSLFTTTATRTDR